MSFSEVSSPSNPEAVMTSLSTFAQANGWVEEHLIAAGSSILGEGVLTLSRGETVVTFRWDGSDTPQAIAMHHALAYPGAPTAQEQEEPWNFATDSGNGVSGSSLGSERRISRIGTGPFVRLTMFSGASDGYILCVLEYSIGKYRHFGFSDVLENKIGNWQGGGWVGGHIWPTGAAASNPNTSSGGVLIDGLNSTTERDRSTVHVRGLAGMNANQRFGYATNSSSDVASTDGAGELVVNINGGLRATYFDRSFQQFVPDPVAGVIQLTPAMLIAKQRGALNHQALGILPGVRMAQIRSFDPGAEVVVGADTWKFFPVVSKANVGGSNEESENMGLAYLKVV